MGSSMARGPRAFVYLFEEGGEVVEEKSQDTQA